MRCWLPPVAYTAGSPDTATNGKELAIKRIHNNTLQVAGVSSPNLDSSYTVSLKLHFQSCDGNKSLHVFKKTDEISLQKLPVYVTIRAVLAVTYFVDF